MQRVSSQRQDGKARVFFRNGNEGLDIAVGVHWTPAAITTALWLDAADATTISLSGSNVTEWRNKSGTTNTYIPNTTGPTVASAAIGGKNALDFGVGLGLTGTRAFATTGSLFYIQKVASDPTYLWFSQSSGATPYGFVAESGSGSSTTNEFGSPTLYVNGAVASSSTRAQVYTSLTTNAVVVGNIDVDLSAWSTAFRIGNFASPYQTFHPDNGLLGELIGISGSITTETRQTVEGYLAHKWGLTASLPSNHPYKSSAPTL